MTTPTTEDTRDWFRRYKAKVKCGRCGETHPATLHFHHRDPTQKDLTVSLAVQRRWTVGRILHEIAKCDVLCANCHAILHYESQGEVA